MFARDSVENVGKCKASLRFVSETFRHELTAYECIQIARTPKDPRAKMQIQKYFLGFSPCELTADGPRSAYFGGSARGLMDRGGKWKGCDPTVLGVGCPWLHGRKPAPVEVYSVTGNRFDSCRC